MISKFQTYKPKHLSNKFDLDRSTNQLAPPKLNETAFRCFWKIYRYAATSCEHIDIVSATSQGDDNLIIKLGFIMNQCTVVEAILFKIANNLLLKYPGIVMEKSWNFFLEKMWEPCFAYCGVHAFMHFALMLQNLPLITYFNPKFWEYVIGCAWD